MADRVLRIDIESFSSVDLKKCGAARYAASPDFEIMLFAYQWIDAGVKAPVVCVDLKSGERVPPGVYAALTDPAVKKTAFNAAFEIETIQAHYGIKLDPAQWECTMVHALYCGLPGGLGDVARVLKVSAQKDFRGSNLIRFFCIPCKPTKKNGQRKRNLPEHDPDRWALFKAYNSKDVEAEDAVADRLAKVPVPEREWHYWRLDLAMNARGVRVDLPLVRNAIAFDARIKADLTAKAIALTGIQNPASVKQLKAWLTEELDWEVTALNKATLPTVATIALDSEKATELLRLRAQLAKASVSKYAAMERAADEEGYIRGLTQFYGANRTGRAAARLVQHQNLRKNAMPMKPIDELRFARNLLLAGAFELFCTLWDEPLDVLSQLVRTGLIADTDCIFAPVDFSAIEARKLAWAAREEWRLEVFRTHGMIYEASAAAMFHVPIESITRMIDGKKVPGPNAHMRPKGKVAELALGYQGGEGALIRMGALEMGLKLEELDPIKVAWRAANQRIAGLSYRDEEPGFWERMNDAAMRALRLGGRHEVDWGIEFRKEHNILFMRLPAGRDLCYVKPSIKDGDYGPEIHFWGLDQVTKQWVEQKSYGGRWTENFCQASSRDLLYHKLALMEERGLHHYVRFHVHDEAVPSIPILGAQDTLKRIEDLFAEPVDWAPGLPLRGDGFLTPFFRKDD